MKTAALAALVSAACLAAPAFAAAPALPVGWSAGEPGVHAPRTDQPRAEISPAMLEAMERASRTARARAIDVDALPTITIPRGRPAGEIPAELPPGSPEDVIVLKAGAARRLNVAGFAAGVLTVERTEAFFGRTGAFGIAGVCGGGAAGRPLKPVVYKAMRQVSPQGELEFVVGRGFIETSTCRVAIEERWSARPARLAGGLVLGFRTWCDDCAEGSRDVLHVITPQLSSLFFFERIVPLMHHPLSLEEGASGIVKGFVGTMSGLSFTPPDWTDFSDRSCGKDNSACSSAVRVEVSRGRGEAKATVIVKPAVDPQ